MILTDDNPERDYLRDPTCGCCMHFEDCYIQPDVPVALSEVFDLLEETICPDYLEASE